MILNSPKSEYSATEYIWIPSFTYEFCEEFDNARRYHLFKKIQALE